MPDPTLVLSFIEVTAERFREMTLGGGFIHITGLELYDHSGKRTGRKVGDDLTTDQLGCWNMNGGVLVLVNQDGHFWIHSAVSDDNRPQEFRMPVEGRDLVHQYAPNGHNDKILVPATYFNADRPSILGLYLLVRLANPTHLR